MPTKKKILLRLKMKCTTQLHTRGHVSMSHVEHDIVHFLLAQPILSSGEIALLP